MPIMYTHCQIMKVEFVLCFNLFELRGGSRISGKVVHVYKSVEFPFADFISFFLNIP